MLLLSAGPATTSSPLIAGGAPGIHAAPVFPGHLEEPGNPPSARRSPAALAASWGRLHYLGTARPSPGEPQEPRTRQLPQPVRDDPSGHHHCALPVGKVLVRAISAACAIARPWSSVTASCEIVGNCMPRLLTAQKTERRSAMPSVSACLSVRAEGHPSLPPVEPSPKKRCIRLRTF